MVHISDVSALMYHSEARCSHTALTELHTLTAIFSKTNFSLCEQNYKVLVIHFLYRSGVSFRLPVSTARVSAAGLRVTALLIHLIQNIN